jgi:hypothetical protein
MKSQTNGQLNQNAHLFKYGKPASGNVGEKRAYQDHKPMQGHKSMDPGAGVKMAKTSDYTNMSL